MQSVDTKMLMKSKFLIIVGVKSVGSIPEYSVSSGSASVSVLNTNNDSYTGNDR